MSDAVVFPGQGAQKPGMGLDFVDAFPAAAAVFDEASEALSTDLRALVRGDDGRLGLTAWTQPALLTTCVALFRAVLSEGGLHPRWFGGHSLGEYTALVAAGALELGAAVRIVHARGRAMQDAVPPGDGAMAAILGEGVDAALLRHLAPGVDLANLNAADQLVLSGAASAVDAALAALAAHPVARAWRAVRLDVSAPFHSRWMAGIEPAFAETLAAAAPAFTPARAAVVTSNFTGAFHTGDAAALRDALTRQISGPVRWVENMQALRAQGPTRVVELGPGRTLRPFFRTVDTAVESVFNLVTARRLASAPAPGSPP